MLYSIVSSSRRRGFLTNKENFVLLIECFRPTPENQEILGDSVAYVHSDFDMNTRSAQWLAKKLDIRLGGG